MLKILSNSFFVIVAIFATNLVLTPCFAVDKIGSDCTFRGIKLYGKVKVVTSFPDIKVQIVKNFPDLKVQKVSNFANKCGKWQFVENFPDFKVQFVENFPDLKIKYVENFPGK